MINYDELEHGKLYLVGKKANKIYNIMLFDRMDVCYYEDDKIRPLAEGDIYWKYWKEIEGNLNDHIIYAIDNGYDVDEDVLLDFLKSLNVKFFWEESFDGGYYQYTYFQYNGQYYYYEDDYAPIAKKCDKERITAKLNILLNKKVDIDKNIAYLYEVLEGEKK